MMRSDTPFIRTFKIISSAIVIGSFISAVLFIWR